MTKPQINVTPLIDVLLVLLIIFIVASPQRPSSFDAKIPTEPRINDSVNPDPQTLVVTVGNNSDLTINKAGTFGSVNAPSETTKKLADVFRQRREAASTALDPTAVERTVFIKAPRSVSYGDVAKVVDAVKQSGSDPISLMIDGL